MKTKRNPMERENSRYQRILEETQETLNQRIRKSRQNKQESKEALLEKFRTHMARDLQQFQKMKQENQKARMVGFQCRESGARSPYCG